MSGILKIIKGRLMRRGLVSYSGRYLVYEYLTIEEADKTIVRIESVAMIPKMGVAIGKAVAFQFADAKKFNTFYEHQFLVAVQQKNEEILTDALILGAAAKARNVVAYLSLIPPFTLIAPFTFKKARAIKDAYNEVGQFEPMEKNFIRKIKRRDL